MLPAIVQQANDRGLLAVNEIYESIQGESSAAGLPGVIVRLTGCPLRCAWCDTTSAYDGGELRSVEDVVEHVRSAGLPTVLVTGGEPLVQRACRPLLAALSDVVSVVLLETSGVLDVRDIDHRVRRVVDMKAPSSRVCDAAHQDNLLHLRAHDEVKFVLADREDYEWACAVIERHDLTSRCGVLMGAVAGHLPPETLVEWILADRLPVRFQLQLHKVIWGADASQR